MVSGIFCVEGQWHRDLNDRSSVLPTLELLERRGEVKFIYKDVAVPDELMFFVDRWLLRQNATYRVGFFAMHGEASRLCLTDWHSVELTELALRMAGRAEGRRLYFGSCSVMRAPDTALIEFLQTTGAELVCGYTREVDWVESAAFEVVLLNVLANGQRVDSAEKRMDSIRWRALAEALGFRIVYSNGQTWRAATN